MRRSPSGGPVVLPWTGACSTAEGHVATRRPRRISLPTYPFAKERYWATGSKGLASSPTPPSPASQATYADSRPDQPASSHAYPESIPSVWRTISTPLPVEDRRIAHILANGELLNRDLDDLLCKLFWGTLQSLGLGREETLLWSHFETIAGIDKKYGRWLEESLNMLVAMGYLATEQDGYRVLDPSPVDMDALWREWEHQKAVWSRQTPQKNPGRAGRCHPAVPAPYPYRQTQGHRFPLPQLLHGIWSRAFISTTWSPTSSTRPWPMYWWPMLSNG